MWILSAKSSAMLGLIHSLVEEFVAECYGEARWSEIASVARAGEHHPARDAASDCERYAVMEDLSLHFYSFVLTFLNTISIFGCA